MKISFTNIEQRAFDKNTNKKDSNLVNYFLFYSSLVIFFLLISLYIFLKSFKQEMTYHEISSYEDNSLSNINSRILVERNETEEEKEEREKQYREAREKIASNASKMTSAYYVFLIKTFYSLLKFRAFKDEELEKKAKMKVYLYLYISNNGYLFTSSIVILLYNFTYEEFKHGYILFYLSGGVFGIGTIMAIIICIKLFKVDQEFINSMYTYDSIKSLYKMPFTSIKNFLLLKDRCCCGSKNQNPYEVQMPKCCCCCGTATILAKYFTLVITAIIYYGSLLFLSFILFIVISCLKLCGKKRELNTEKVNENENEKKQDSEMSQTFEGEQNLVNTNNDNGLNNNQPTSADNPSGYNNY